MILQSTAEKGRLAEFKVLSHFSEWGCEVALVLGDNTSCDLIVLKDGVPFRVEVKYGPPPARGRSTQVSISTSSHRRADGLRPPNRPVDLSRFELLAVYMVETDEVLVWSHEAITAKQGFVVTKARRELALKGPEDLVESTVTRQGHLDGLCLCRECAPSKADHIAYSVPSSERFFPNSEVR